MTPEDFCVVGVRLYGERGWRTQLATRLGMDRTTIWRYANGQRRIPLRITLAMGMLEREKWRADGREVQW